MRARAFLWLAILAIFVTPARAMEVSTLHKDEATFTIVRVDPRHDHLQLFLNGENGMPYGTFKALSSALDKQGQHLVFAMNAGMFEHDLSPVGLLVTDGRALTKLNLASGYGNFYLKPNGVFLLNTEGARVVESSEFDALKIPALLATQSGPLLLQHGVIHPAFKPNSASRLIRNAVGVTPSGEVVFAISETPVNFYEFAILFRDVLHCPDALYLDGTVSGLFSPSVGRDDRKTLLGPIIGVTTGAMQQ